MRRRLIVLAALAAGGGCVTPEDRKDWAAAMKDLHGDNMRMRSGGAGADPDRASGAADGAAAGDRPTRAGPRRPDGEAGRDRFPAGE